MYSGGGSLHIPVYLLQLKSMIWSSICYVRFLFNIFIFLIASVLLYMTIVRTLYCTIMFHSYKNTPSSCRSINIPLILFSFLFVWLYFFFIRSYSSAPFCSLSYMHVDDEILKILCICRRKWNGLSFVFLLDCNGIDEIKKSNNCGEEDTIGNREKERHRKNSNKIDEKRSVTECREYRIYIKKTECGNCSRIGFGTFILHKIHIK